jgi:hypothetical protein
MYVLMGTIDNANVSTLEDLYSMKPALSEYVQHFEQSFLQQSCRYIRQKAQTLLREDSRASDTPAPASAPAPTSASSLGSYLAAAETLMQRELEQAALFLPASSISKLRAIYVFELVVAQSARLGGGIPDMVERAVLRALERGCSSLQYADTWALCTDASTASSASSAGLSFLLEGEDQALLALIRAFRMFSLADAMFPPSSRYQFENLDEKGGGEGGGKGAMAAESSMEDDDVARGGGTPAPREAGALLRLLGDSFFACGVQEGQQLLATLVQKETEAAAAAEKEKEKETETEGSGGGGGGRAKRSREKSEEAGGGGVKGEGEKGVGGGSASAQGCLASSSSSTASSLVSPPFKRSKSLQGVITPTANDEKRRTSGSGRKSTSSAKKLQKSRVLAEDKYVMELLRMLKIFNQLVVSVFQNESQFVQIVKKMSREIVNKSEVAVTAGAAPTSVNQVDVFVGYSDRKVNVSNCFIYIYIYIYIFHTVLMLW